MTHKKYLIIWVSTVLALAGAISFINCAVGADDGSGQFAAPALLGAAAVAATGPVGMEGNVSLDLRNIDVVEALKFVAMKAGINIIATKNVAGRVTLMVDNVPVRDIFDIMLRSNGLAYTKQGNIYNVMTEDEYKGLFGKKFSDIRSVKVFRLKYAIPDQAFTMLDALKSDIGRVLVEPDSGTALVMDTPEKIVVIESALASLEQKNMVKTFTLKYAKAKEVEEQLKTQLDAKKVGTVKADERSNSVMVQTLPERMAGIEKMIESLDRKTKEVLIDTKIIKVKLTNQRDEGVKWEGLAALGKELGYMYLGTTPFSVIQGATDNWMSRNEFLHGNPNTPTPGQDSTTGVGAYPFSGNTSAIASTASSRNPGQNMHLGVIDPKRDMDMLINYVESLGKTQVLSNPTIAVINNQEARIHVGERQAYVTTTTTTGQTTTTVSEEVTFVDVGIQLSVTPTINDDGFVTLKIKPEISSVVSTLLTPTNNRIPIIDTSMAETTVMVKDGMTIVIGGLRKEEKTGTDDHVPFLGNIPIFGFFFKNTSKTTTRTELMILLTPHIVTGDRLTTGDDRYFDKEAAKKYEEYKGITEGTDYEPPSGSPEERIKPYLNYSTIAKEKKEDYQPGIKGERDE